MPYGSRECVLSISPPDINRYGQPTYSFRVAKGRRDDLFGLAAKLFNTRHGAWTEDNEQTWSYPIQGTEDAPVQLTPREKKIMDSLATIPNQTADDLCVVLNEESANIVSALRFLYESGLLVVDDGTHRYSVRRI
jgi:hypothetical protein